MVASEIAIVSGKGGTGKTTIAAAFVAIAGNVVMADCDVDAPDLHILLQPDMNQTDEFISSKVTTIDKEACTECGLCEEACRFEAAHPPEINPITCEGCGVCEYICPEKAITMHDKVSGHIHESNTRFGPMVHAKLLPGEGNSGLLVTEVRQRSVQVAKKTGQELVLIDGSPGIGCPVIATVTGLRLGVVVTEPTLAGIHDMKRVLGLLKKFKIRSTVIINKFDLNLDNSKDIERFCHENDVEILGKLPFNPIMTKSMVAGKTLPEYRPEHELTDLLHVMWTRIVNIVNIDQ
ncbi:MAG: ATP-binding protein [Candidatus Thorarchaeota archaeon]|jgi:MinD superfamily P-loop ATPase